MSSPGYQTQTNPPPAKLMRVFVLLTHSFGAQRWKECWARGELAGIQEELPYGYFHCAGKNCEVRYSEDASENSLTQLFRRCLRRLLGFDLIHAWRNREGIAGADVVWTHTELEHLAVLLLFRLGLAHDRRPKLIAQSVWLFDRWRHFSALKRWAYRRLLEHADILTVLSPDNLRIAHELFPAQRSELVLFGIDSSRMRPARRCELGRPMHVLSLGNDMHRDWETLIKGLGGWSECEVRIGGKRIGRHVRRSTRDFANLEIVTPKSGADIDRLYEWADFVVIPLKHNFHASGITVVTEAVLLGVPVICTDTGGLRAYFSGDEVSYVPLAAPHLLRDAIERLSRKDDLRFTMARQAQARVVNSNLNSRAFAYRHYELSRTLLEQADAEPAAPPAGQPAGNPVRVFVFLGHGFGASWARGELPGINEAMPYGYHHAGDEGCVVTYSEDAPEGRFLWFVRMGIRKWLGFDPLHAWRNRRGLRDTDVVWTHTELESLAALALLRMLPSASRPRVIAQSVWLFGRWSEFWMPKRWLYQRLLRHADVLTVQCEANLVAARRLLPDARVQVVPYGIDLEKMVAARPRPLHTPIRILSLGRDMHRDWATLIAATAHRPEFEVRIGAKTISRSAVAMGDNLTLVKPTSAQLAELYEWADLVVIALKPNIHASGITVLAEAALFGVPVVCTGTGGLQEYFGNECVKYVPPGDSASMRRAINEVAASDRLRFAMARNAQARFIVNDLSTRARAKRLAALSRELLSEKTPGARGGSPLANPAINSGSAIDAEALIPTPPDRRAIGDLS